MEIVPTPDEANRLLALRALKILDTPEEESFDRLTRMAANIFGTPTALISLVDGRRQWFKSRVGFESRETDRSVSLCAHALGDSEPLVVPDAAADPRFADNPLVTGQPYIRFYAGAQLRTTAGFDLGTLCIIDTEPRQHPTARQLSLLQDLAETATLLMEQRRMVMDYEAHAEARARAEDKMRHAKEAAESATAEMRALFSRVSHDLRTPLGAISGFAELLAETPLSEDQKSDVEEIRRAGRDLLVMIDSLLQVARATDH